MGIKIETEQMQPSLSHKDASVGDLIDEAMSVIDFLSDTVGHLHNGQYGGELRSSAAMGLCIILNATNNNLRRAQDGWRNTVTEQKKGQ